MTIYKKNDKYYCRFKIHGEQKHLLCQGARSLSEAQAIEDAEKFKLRQQQAGLLKKEYTLTLGQVLDDFGIWSELNKKSYATDRSRIKKLKTLLPCHKRATETTPNALEKLKKTLLDEGMDKITINKYLSLISVAFKLEIKNKKLEYNPCDDVDFFHKKNVTTRYLKDDEENILNKVLPQYLRDIKDVALYTGLRKSNVIFLQWKQIDLDLDIIEILENKGNKHIILPIIEPLKEILLRLKENNNSEYVFVNPETGTKYYEIDRAWRKCLNKAGIKNFRFHDLRHTVGTRLAKEGVPVNVIQSIMAHSDVQTTMRYIHLVEKQKLYALNKLIVN